MTSDERMIELMEEILFKLKQITKKIQADGIDPDNNDR